MKKSKIIIPALAMLVMSTAATVTGTVAWFSMNKSVTASDMKVKAQAEGSIIITKAGGAMPATGSNATDVMFTTEEPQTLYSSTHSDSYSTHASGLKVVTAGAVNPETGSALNSDTTLTYGAATNAGSIVYYVDFDVYLCGMAAAMSNKTLTITLDGSYTSSKTINKALSIDYYVAAISGSASASTNPKVTANSTNYKGTLNLAGTENNDDDNGTESCTELSVSSVNIPVVGSGNALGIKMRVYYDGNLIEDGGTEAYTAYTAAASDATAQAGGYYYTDDTGATVAEVDVGDDVSDYYIVDSEASTYRYARTTDVGDFEAVALNSEFTVA